MGTTPGWKTYVRLYAKGIFLPTYGTWTLHVCERLSRMRPKRAVENQWRPSQLFTESRPLEFITKDILRPLLKTLSGNQVLLIITDRYKKLTRDVSIPKTTASHNEASFVDSWVIPYGFSKYDLTNSETQFITKFFELLCAFLCTKHLKSRWITSKRSGKLDISIGRQLHDRHTTWLIIWETRMYTCSSCRNRVATVYKDRRV